MSSIIKPPLGTVINPLHPLSRGLVGYWLMNEGAGSLAQDISGKGNHGRLTNMAPNVQGSGWGGSKFGGGLWFDGVNDYVNAGNDVSLNFGDGSNDKPFTFVAWVNGTENLNDGLISRYGGAGEREYNFYIDGSNNLTLVIRDDSAGASCYIVSTLDLSSYTNSYHQMVGTYSGIGGANAGDGLNFYFDGQLLAKTTTNNGNYVAMENLGYDTKLGVTGISFCNGSIGPTHIYERALLPQEAKQLCLDPFCNLLVRRPSGLYVPAAPGVSIPVFMYHYNQLARA